MFTLIRLAVGLVAFVMIVEYGSNVGPVIVKKVCDTSNIPHQPIVKL